MNHHSPRYATGFVGLQFNNEELFDSLADTRQKLTIWRYRYNNIQAAKDLKSH